jgi:hypothetical protein
MTSSSRTVLSGLGALAFFALHCGGSSPPAQSPTGSSGGPALASSVSPAKAKATQPSTTAEASQPAEASSGEKPTRPPHEILQLKDTLFKLNFEESDRGQTAATACDQKAGDTPKKRSACMTQARDALDIADAYQVQRQGEDWLWKAVRLRGNRLITLSKDVFEFGEETENSIAIKFQGKPPKGFASSEVKISVPSDYLIVVPDARYGRLVYEAKVGIASGGE